MTAQRLNASECRVYNSVTCYSLSPHRHSKFLFMSLEVNFSISFVKSGHLSDAEQRQIWRTFRPLCCVYSGDCVVPRRDIFWFELEFSLAGGAEGSL